MKLISCDVCAVILDQDKIGFPTDMYDDDDAIDPEKAKYNQENKRYEPYVRCPVCESIIFQE